MPMAVAVVVPARATVRGIVRVSRLVLGGTCMPMALVHVVAAAPVLLAQAMDVLDALARLGHLVHEVGLARAPRGQVARRGMQARVALDEPKQRVDDDARDQRHERLAQKDRGEPPRVDVLGHEQGQHLVRCR